MGTGDRRRLANFEPGLRTLRLLPDDVAGNGLFLQPDLFRDRTEGEPWSKGLQRRPLVGFHGRDDCRFEHHRDHAYRAYFVSPAGRSRHDDVPDLHGLCHEPSTIGKQEKEDYYNQTHPVSSGQASEAKPAGSTQTDK